MTVVRPHNRSGDLRVLDKNMNMVMDSCHLPLARRQAWDEEGLEMGTILQSHMVSLFLF